MDKHELVKILQEQRKHTLEIQNQILEKNNECFIKMLSNKDEQIPHLKGHNQDLEDHIKKSKNDEKSPYRRDNDFKEDIKRLNKLIKDKDSELVQSQKKLEDQESKICQHQQQQEMSDRSMTTSRKRTS